MVETARADLINLLLAGYDDLKRRLARRLGSVDLAADALQDTFLRLNTSIGIGPVKSPQAYLFRVAIRLATKRRKIEALHTSLSDIELAMDMVDDKPDPGRIVEARSEIEELKRGMAEMPERRRAILIAALLDEVPHPLIAKRFKVSVRTIQTELKLALVHCAKRLDRDLNVSRRLRPVANGTELSLLQVGAIGDLGLPSEKEQAFDEG